MATDPAPGPPPDPARAAVPTSDEDPDQTPDQAANGEPTTGTDLPPTVSGGRPGGATPSARRRPGWDRPPAVLAAAIMATSFLLVLALMLVVRRSGPGPVDADHRAAETGDPAGPSLAPGAGPDAGAGPSTLPVVDLDLRPGPWQLTLDPPAGADGDAVVDPGDELEAVGPGDPVRAVVSAEGTALFRGLEPGPVEVRLLDDGGQAMARTEPIEVPGDRAPDSARYRDTTLRPGHGYVETRDGTTLSTLVTLPGPVEEGPYPTLVEYSGYQPSRPTGTDPTRLIVPSLGYALVQVNVRGTGCSGGSFDAFEPIQSLDGYDVIETVAAQDWSARVGMFGVSYAGLMQLQVAATRPPSLAAIAPLSVFSRIDNVIHPGGIANDGFARTWADQVGDGAQAYGQGWEQALVDGGDTTCAANQLLRAHNPDLVALARSAPFDLDLLDARSPISAAPRVEVPVFLAGAWQDEQTGPDWPALIGALSSAPVLRVELYNGLHIDAIAPEVLASVTEFYDLYLDDPDPGADPGLRVALSLGLASLYGDTLPVHFADLGDDREEARRVYEAEPPIRVRFDLGARRPNLPLAGFEARFEQWPPAAMEPGAYAVGPPSADGRPGELTLTGGRPTGPVAAPFVTDPSEGSRVTADDGPGLWTAEPGWHWPTPAPGRGVVAASPPLTHDLLLAGPASADLWLSADRADADIEVTISEIAPDGSETFVQAGQLRLSRRALTGASTELEPVRSLREDDVEPLPVGGEPVLVRVAISPFAHAFRTGSRLAVTLDTPGASHPSWTFDVLDTETAVTLHSSPDRPSRVVLPVLGGMEAPTPRPPCGSLRGQPCRTP